MAFLHGDCIRFEFFRRCVVNAALEKQQAAQDRQSDNAGQPLSYRQIVTRSFTDMFNSIVTWLVTKQNEELLPDVLQLGRREDSFDRVRVRRALRRLRQHSLILHNDETDTYSMHHLIQRWARERTDMRLADQCRWAAAAARFVADCVLIPPLGDSVEDERLRKDLLGHVYEATEHETELERQNLDYRERDVRHLYLSSGLWEFGRMLWRPLDLSRMRVQARFAVVFAHNGRWTEAKDILKEIYVVALGRLGLADIRTRRVALALADVYRRMGQSDKSAQLQEDILAACSLHRGPAHPETLAASHKLGESRFHQGRISDALTLQQQAVAGMKQVLGPGNQTTLESLVSLGLTLSMFRTEDALNEAKFYQESAYAGLQASLGSCHSKTLQACESLCATISLMKDKSQLLRAEHLMQDVREQRKDSLGPEHPDTLIAMLTLARVKASSEDYDGAQGLFDTGLAIAEKLFEPDFAPYLWAQYIMGQMWVRQRRWSEARDLLTHVTNLQRHALQGYGDCHPERIGPLAELAEAHQELGEYEDCDRIVTEVLRAIERISVSGDHPVGEQIKASRERWEAQRIHVPKTSSDKVARPSNVDDSRGSSDFGTASV